MSQSLLHYEQGKICYQNKKFDDAIFQFTEAIRLKPENGQALARCYNARGVVYFYLGEFKKVIRDCTKALELDPENANYHNCRGNAYFSLGKFSKAAEDFTQAIELSPEASHGRYYNNRGSAYRRLKQFKEAIDDYSKAISIDGKNGNYYNNRGNTYFDMGEFQLAIDDFTVALTLEPYSPKTKLTLAQAHEALAQEKRMKNSTQYEGVFSSVKKEGKESRRKDRPAQIYVSPNGVEVSYVRGWRKRKEQVPYEWSEDMKIELIDDSHVKLFLDKTRVSWVVISTRDAPAVEEELIGRITTKFASYSTACLVAQHEGVCNEYAEILKHVKDAQSELAIYESLLSDAQKQKEQFIAQEDFGKADQSSSNLHRLQDQIRDKRSFIESETQRAELVRVKAEQEAGPVLDMVLIMQNRVRELYHNRVKDVKGQYKVEDLHLEEQLNKMDTLVIRAQELAQLVSKPVTEIQRAFENLPDEDEAEEMEEEEQERVQPAAQAADLAAAQAEEAQQAKAEAEAHAARQAAAAEEARQQAEAAAAAAQAAQAALQAEAMETARVAAEAAQQAKAEAERQAEAARRAAEEYAQALRDLQAAEEARKAEAARIAAELEETKRTMEENAMRRARAEEEERRAREAAAAAAAAAAPEPSEVEQRSLDDFKEKEDSDLSDWGDVELDANNDNRGGYAGSAGHEVFMTVEGHGGMVTIMPSRSSDAFEVSRGGSEVVLMKRESIMQMTEEQKETARKLAELEAARQAAEAQLSEKDTALKSLLETNLSLATIRAESEKLTSDLAAKMSQLENTSSDLTSKLELTAREKEELQGNLAEQKKQAEVLKAHLDSVNKALMAKSQESDEKTRRFEQMAEKSAELEKLIGDMKQRSENDKLQAQQAQADYDRRMAKMVEESQALREALEATSMERSVLKQEVERQNMTMSELRQHLARMQNDLQRANEERASKLRELNELAEAKAAVERKRQEDEQLIEKMKEQARAEELKRRQLHNLIQEIKGNIRVYIRIRPDLKNRNNGHQLYEDIVGSDGRALRVVALPEKSATGGGDVNKKWAFEFDRVFWPNNSQQVVFEEISQLVQSALDGFKVSIFAYGQTGSGKTYTMEGPDNPTAETRGMIPRSVEQIFKYSEEMREKGWEYRCEASFLEIYNQDIRDLLVSAGSSELDVKMQKDASGQMRTVVPGLTCVPVASAADLAPLLARASSNRSSAATQSNERSSRSHSVFTLRILGENKESGVRSEGVLNLVDLAGSERIDKSQVTGTRLEETKAINSSLTCLGDVIASLAQGAKHVPFRNSKLTYLLQDSFGNGSKTLMFINLAGELEHIQETLCSLRFGAKVHECHIGAAKKQIKSGEEAADGTAAAAAAAKKPAAKKK